MKAWQYVTTMLLGVACLGVSIAIVLTAMGNQTIQEKLQARQAQLNNSVLGPRTQQVASQILQEMAKAAAKNDNLRSLLTKHGYTVTSGEEVPAE